jgi:2-dehydropantoate 2-reductase
MVCAESRRVSDAVMSEVRAVAAAFGSDIPITNQQRLDFAESVGAHKTSMLQDFEAGRPLEPIVGAVIEMAEKAGLIVPHLRAIYACAKLLARP